MKQLILAILLTLCSAQAWGASCTSTGSGYWSDNTKWGGACASTGVPGTGTFATYSGIVAAGHRVEINDARTIYAASVGTSTSSIASLYVSGSVTPLFNIRVGDDASGYVGRLKIRGGSALTLSASAGIILNKCEFMSYSTSSSSRATVAGTGGAILAGTKASASSGVGMDLNLSYTDFSNTGIITLFPTPLTDGIVNSQINLTYNTFVGTGSITMGRSGWTAVTVPYNIQHNDFRDNASATTYYGSGASVLLIGIGNARTVTAVISYNTFKNSGLVTSYKGSSGLRGVLIERNVFYDSILNNSSGQYLETRYNALYESTAAPSLVAFIRSKDEYYHHNIVGTDKFNSHPHDFTGALAGSGAAVIDSNIVETNALDDNPFLPGHYSETYSNNLVIGAFQDAWEMHEAVTDSANFTLLNNTVVSKANYASYGRLVAAETGYYPAAGTGTIRNNLLYFDAATSGGSISAYAISGHNESAASAAIDVLDYNDYYAARSNLTALNAGDPSSTWVLNPPTGISYGQDNFGMHDKTVNPNFTNVNYSISTFTGSNREAFFADQLKINGYGGASALSLDALRTALIVAFTPTNPALKGTGFGGVDIGAVAVQVAATTATKSRIGFFSLGF